MNRWLLLIMMTGLGAVSAGAADDILIADFEGDSYGGWKVEGDAFGTKPSPPPDHRVWYGFKGLGAAQSRTKDDNQTGSLTSPPFTIKRTHLNFLAGCEGDSKGLPISLVVDGKDVQTIYPPKGNLLQWVAWDVSTFQGKQAVMVIKDTGNPSFGALCVDHIYQSNTPAQSKPIVTTPLYAETFRPRFHYTAQKTGINDADGLVYYKGVWHLCYIDRPAPGYFWGHAISKDLVHWKQLPFAIGPDENGCIYSGSSVVDHDNTSGFGTKANPPVVAVFTYAGNFSNPPRLFTQGIAYSTDGGMTFTKYAGNPVMPNFGRANRDPKVFWHEPTKKWVMMLFGAAEGDGGGRAFGLFGSKDLKTWERLGTMDMGGHECPDLYEMPIDGNPANTRWIAWEADCSYCLGTFDGHSFKTLDKEQESEFGGHSYAGQTFNNAPDKRRVLITWMRGGVYPNMPFGSQMSFPREVSLRTTAEGPKLHFWPIKEIEIIRGNKQSIKSQSTEPKENPTVLLPEQAYDIELECDLGTATRIIFYFHGLQLNYDCKSQLLACENKSVRIVPQKDRLSFRVLLDVTSIELFAHQGAIVISRTFVPKPGEQGFGIRAIGGKATVARLDAWPIASIWNEQNK